MPYREAHVNVGISEKVHRLLGFFAHQRGVTIADLADRAIVLGLVALEEQEQPDGGAGLTPDGARELLRDLARGVGR